MKKSIKTILIILISSMALGQEIDVENLMTKRSLSCYNVYYNCTLLIPEYYENENYDTLQAIMNFWENKCGQSDEFIRCRILLSIDNNTFTEDLYDASIISTVLFYKRRASALDYSAEETDSSHYWTEYFVVDNLDRFTFELSKKLLDRADLSITEIFFLRMFSNDFNNTFQMLTREEFNDTKIQEYYYREIGNSKQKVVGHGDVLAGVWIPLDNLSIVGTHPSIGFRGGLMYRKLTADATLGLRFGKSPNEYQVQMNDSIWNTTHFLGVYIGLDLGYELFRFENISFNLIGGIGYDAFDALEVNETCSCETSRKSLGSLNLNIGLGNKYYIKNWNYIGVDLKYNIVDYNNPNGTDLSGNAITLNVIFGFIGGKFQDRRLQELDYKW